MASDENAPVRITNRELYDLLQETLQLSRETRQIVEGLTNTQVDHEARLRELEEEKSTMREELRVFKGRVTLLGTLGFPLLAAIISAVMSVLLM